ncbi:hypothetical protein ACFY1V_13045 [Streptomyces sp. NPDC001255]|uniref:hypothetical protein n=1 Tax=Streptomyces sp. NPDC001255 TaxID=3364550 RepID=UPI0036782C2F
MRIRTDKSYDAAAFLRELYGDQDPADNPSAGLALGLIDGDADVPLTMPSGPISTAALATVLDGRNDQLRKMGMAPNYTAVSYRVRSEPGEPDLTDEQCAGIARRLVAASGLAPYGDPYGCPWVALRVKPRHLHIIGTVIRRDGGRFSNYPDDKALMGEFHRIARELAPPPALVPPGQQKSAALDSPSSSHEAGSDLRFADQIRAAQTLADVGDLLNQFVHPEHGVVARTRDALAIASERLVDLDARAHPVRSQLLLAARRVGLVQGLVARALEDLRELAPPAPGTSPTTAPARAAPSAARVPKAPSAPQAPIHRPR